MAVYLDLFSPTTYEAFIQSDRTVSGFQRRHRRAAERVKPGDRLLCYMTKLSRWFGVLDVEDGPFEDESPLFYPADDPFVIRFHVKPAIWLPVERAVPIKEDELWNHLSFTKGYAKNDSAWAQRVKGSLSAFNEHDAAVILNALNRQVGPEPVQYPYDVDAYRGYVGKPVQTGAQPVIVSVPTAADEADTAPLELEDTKDVRESLKIQALLARIGVRMGFTVWIPKADRAAVVKELGGDATNLLDKLPLNYDETTIRTIEQIDVLWLKSRSIRRAFEVEHTTSIYSGILRMADLLALQPNMSIKLHIVAPESRREKVFQEITRPVFSLIVENEPLSKRCTFMPYDDVRLLASNPNLSYMTDRILEEYEEVATE